MTMTPIERETLLDFVNRPATGILECTVKALASVALKEAQIKQSQGEPVVPPYTPSDEAKALVAEIRQLRPPISDWPAKPKGEAR